MKGKIKAFEGVYPITTLAAVKVCDGTDKSLKDMIDNGELGNSSDVVIDESNFITDAYLYVDDVKFPSIDLISGDIQIQMSSSYTNNRSMIYHLANGTSGSCEFLGTADSNYILTLKNGELLFYDIKDKSIKITTNINHYPYQVLIARNNGGRIISGIIKSHYDREVSIRPIKENIISMLEIERSNNQPYRDLHSMFVKSNKLITLEVPSSGDSHVYDLTNFEVDNSITYEKSFKLSLKRTNSSSQEYELRLVACDYSDSNNALILGNSVGIGSPLPDCMAGYIFYNVDTWMNNGDIPITFENCGTYAELLFNCDRLSNLEAAKICWDRSSNNCIILTAGNARHIFRILLGKGSDVKTNGIYKNIGEDKFNGTYEILNQWTSPKHDYGCKDLVMCNGGVIYPIKRVDGGYYYHKAYLCKNGTIKIEEFLYNPVDKDGISAIKDSPEGIAYYKGKLIMGHASYRKFYVSDVF